jgi:phosphatidylglycerol---prolipoprotein diacylglyceryl transferase
MHRELLSVPHIGAYSAMLLLGILGGYIVTRWCARQAGIAGRHIDNLALIIAVLSLFGARLFSWWFYFPPNSSFWRAMTSTGGGMVFYGGMIFGIAAVILYAKVAKLALARLMDVCAPGLALGLALGRVGCFMAGCCWGDLCASDAEASRLSSSAVQWQVRTFAPISSPNMIFAVSFPPEAAAFRQHVELGLISPHAARSLPVHPVQLYEAALALMLCMLLLWKSRSPQWPGQSASTFAIGYSAIRFAAEFLRADNLPRYGGLTLSQVISIMIAVAAVLLTLARKSPLGTGDEVPAPVRIS